MMRLGLDGLADASREALMTEWSGLWVALPQNN